MNEPVMFGAEDWTCEICGCKLLTSALYDVCDRCRACDPAVHIPQVEDALDVLQDAYRRLMVVRDRELNTTQEKREADDALWQVGQLIMDICNNR